AHRLHWFLLSIFTASISTPLAVAAIRDAGYCKGTATLIPLNSLKTEASVTSAVSNRDDPETKPCTVRRIDDGRWARIACSVVNTRTAPIESSGRPRLRWHVIYYVLAA